MRRARKCRRSTQCSRAKLLRRALEHIGPAYGEVTRRRTRTQPGSGCGLPEILPLAAVERQELLEPNDGPERLGAGRNCGWTFRKRATTNRIASPFECVASGDADRARQQSR